MEKSQGLRVNHIIGISIKLRSSKKSPSDVCVGIAVNLVDGQQTCVLSSLESVTKSLAVAEVVQWLRLISVSHLAHCNKVILNVDLSYFSYRLHIDQH